MAEARQQVAGSVDLPLKQDAEGRLETVESYPYMHITGDTQVKGFPGVIHTLTVNSCTVAGTLTLYDNDVESGDVIAVIVIPITPVPFTLRYDLEFVNALYAGYDDTLVTDITISYR